MGTHIHMMRRVVMIGAAVLLSVGGARVGLVFNGDVKLSAQAPAPPAGQTVTRLPDGRLLQLGGQDASGSIATASIVDPRTQNTFTLPDGMVEARAWHSATLLSTGQVLIVGGVGSAGQPLGTAELFDPDLELFMAIPFADVTPRAGHSSTLLTDGRVLIAGGTTTGNAALTQAEVWNANDQTIAPVGGSMQPRKLHAALLQADGRVYLTGGSDPSGQPVSVAEMFNPGTMSVSLWTDPVQDPDGPPVIAEARPADGAVDVPLGTFITLRVSRLLNPDTVNDQTVVLSAPQGSVSLRVFPAEGGRLVFARPFAPLQTSTTYTLTATNVTDLGGAALVAAPIRFTTVTATTETDPEFWVPDQTSFDHHWVTNRPPSPWQTLAPLQAEPGVTAVSGQVLTLNGQPLPDVTLGIDAASARTDSTGRFLLRLGPASTGHKELVIDGRTVTRVNRAYGLFEYGMAVTAGQTTVLPFTVWMPLLDTAHQVTIPSPTASETVITTPYIPGLELHLPAGTVLKDHDGRVATTISLTPIPVDRPPFPLANNVDVPVYFTAQPGGGYIETPGTGPKGGWLVYPNYHHAVPGQRVQFFHYDPDENGWYVYGLGTVTANAAQVVPDPKTRVYELTGAMINDGESPADDAPTVGCPECVDPVDPSKGIFVMHDTDLYLPDVIPLALTRTYESADRFIRPFGRGMMHPYAMFLWSANQYQEADLVLAEGGKIHFARTTPGDDYRNAVLVHEETATTSATPTRFYKSEIRWNGLGWNLRLTDGTVYVFGENAPLQAIRDRYGNTVTIVRGEGYGNQRGTIKRVISPNGRWIAFTYDGSNRVTEAKDNIGRTVNYTYDPNGNLSTVTDPAGHVTTYTYTASNQLETVTNNRSIRHVTNVYQNGRVVRQIPADSALHYDYAYTTDGAGNITQTDVTDPRGNVERMTFNSDHYVITDIEALGTSIERTTLYERQPKSNLVMALTDGLNRRTTRSYDQSGRVIAVTRLAGTSDAVTIRYTYEPFGQITSVTDPLDHVWTFMYDEDGRATGARDPLNHQTSVGTDPAGRVTSVTDALGHTWQFSYAGADLASVNDPIHAARTRFVDGGGRTTAITDELGRTTRIAVDKLNRTTGVTNAANGQAAVAYDENGNVQAITDALGHGTTYSYDAFDRVATRTDPRGRVEQIEYDSNGNVAMKTDRKGQVTHYDYDALDRVTTLTFSDDSTVMYTYDAGDRITQVVDSSNGTVTRSYNLRDRLTEEVTTQGTVTYTYNADGQRTTMTVSGQPQVTYSYDDAHRLTAVTQADLTVALVYDEVGRRSNVVFPNGVVAIYTYDDANRVIGISYTSGTTTLGDLTSTYDAAGNRTGIGGSWARSALPAALVSATYDEANRLQTQDSASATFDLNGNMTSDGVNTYIWNTRNQLVAVTGNTTASFAYDAMGRRRGKTVDGRTTNFLYDGLNVVQEQLQDGTPSANLLTGLRVDETFTRTDGGQTNTLLSDVLGSTVAIADAAGNVITTYTFEPFGGTTIAGAPSTNTSQFSGRENDGTGLYYFRARYLHVSTGRFLSEDPAGFVGGSNLYSYVNDNPVSYLDPFGLKPCDDDCDEQVREIQRSADELAERYAEYDKPKWWLPTWGSSMTRESHVVKIVEWKGRLRRLIDKYKNQDPPCPPLPPGVEEWADRPVPDVTDSPPGLPPIPQRLTITAAALTVLTILLRLAPVLAAF